jgi:ATP dependent DNA ligase domain
MFPGSASFDEREPKADGDPIVPEPTGRRLSSSSALTLSGILSSVRLTMNHQTIWKRTDRALLSRCSASRSRRCPRIKTGPLRSNSTVTAALLSSAAQTSRCFLATRKCSTSAFPKVVEALASPAGDFVLDGELVALDPQGRPSFQLLQNNLSRALPVYFYAFDLPNRDRELLLNLSIERRRELLGRMLGAPKTRCASPRCCERLQEKFLRPGASSVLKVSLANESAPYTSLASDQARASSAARIESRSSSLAVTFPLRTGSMHCSWAFTKTNGSSLSRR